MVRTPSLKEDCPSLLGSMAANSRVTTGGRGPHTNIGLCSSILLAFILSLMVRKHEENLVDNAEQLA